MSAAVKVLVVCHAADEYIQLVRVNGNSKPIFDLTR